MTESGISWLKSRETKLNVFLDTLILLPGLLDKEPGKKVLAKIQKKCWRIMMYKGLIDELAGRARHHGATSESILTQLLVLENTGRAFRALSSSIAAKKKRLPPEVIRLSTRIGHDPDREHFITALATDCQLLVADDSDFDPVRGANSKAFGLKVIGSEEFCERYC